MSLRSAPLNFRMPPKRSAPTANPFDVLQLIDELRKMHAEFSKNTELIKKAMTAFEAVKRGPPGLPGKGIDGVDGRSVTPADVEAAVRKILVQPKNGVAPTLEEVAGAVLRSPKIYKFIQKQIKENSKQDENDDSKEEKDEMETTKKMVEDMLTGLKKELEGRVAEVRNYAATQAGRQYGKDTMVRGGGDTVVAGSGVTITNTKNGNKQISASGGGGFQAPTSGAVDGSNQTFVWATAPNVIVTDQGRAMQKVSSDGTVNWTGTTTTILTVAPTSDIYATA